MTKPTTKPTLDDVLVQLVSLHEKINRLLSPPPHTTPCVCASCGQVTFATRLPKRGQRSFCKKCREDGAPVRFAKRDQRAREEFP